MDALLARQPDLGDAWRTRGMCRTRQGDWQGAALDFERAATLVPRSLPEFQAEWDEARRRLGGR